MTAITATSNGTGGFASQAPEIAHLLKHGLSGEIKGLYSALSLVLGLKKEGTIDEWLAPLTGSTLQLSYAPRVRMGKALIARELVNGALVSPPTGTLAQSGGAGSPWIYTPATAPGTTDAKVTGSTDATAGALYGIGGTLDSTQGTVTGTTDITAAGLYGPGGTLAGGGTGLTLILNVNGAGPLTLTFDGAGLTNDASEAAMLAAIHTTWPALTATASGVNLLLTDSVRGSTSTVVIGAGTANTALGLAAPTNVSGVTSTLILNVNGAGALTLVLNGSTNTASQAALLAAIEVEWPAVTATVVSTHLTITDNLPDPSHSIVVGAGTSNTPLGLTPGTYVGGAGHNYAITYEVDASSIPQATLPVIGAPYAGGPGTGSPSQL